MNNFEGYINNLKNESESTKEVKNEMQALQKFLSSIYKYTDPNNNEVIEYYFCEDLFVKKLPNINQVANIYQEYITSVYIGGDFFRHLKQRDYLENYKRLIENDEEKANKLVDIISNIEVFKGKSNIKMLDIGCGYGAFVYCWKNKSLGEAYGIDISQQAKDASLNIYKDKDVKIDTLNANKIQEIINNYNPDLICCFDFLEHCFDAELFLYDISVATKEKSFLLLYMPILNDNEMSIELLAKNKYFKKNHIYYFTYKGIIKLVESNGFKYIYDNEIKQSKYLFVFKKINNKLSLTRPQPGSLVPLERRGI